VSRPPRRPTPPRHTVAVEIAGEKHVLRSDVPPEYTRAVAGHVDATIRALPGFRTLEPFRAATLAALSITDELFRAREEIRRLREEAERRTGELADVLEAAEAAGAEKRPVRRPGAAASAWTTESGDAELPEAHPSSPDGAATWRESAPRHPPTPAPADDAGEPELMLPPPDPRPGAEAHGDES
jgi:cell division protein ZapA (FtsZ GTPase activity inhibitor)